MAKLVHEKQFDYAEKLFKEGRTKQAYEEMKKAYESFLRKYNKEHAWDWASYR